jgi:RNase P/RNase MRP subunit POP5
METANSSETSVAASKTTQCHILNNVSDRYETEREVRAALRLHNAVGTSYIIIVVLYISGAHPAWTRSWRGKWVQGRVLLAALGRP